MKNLLFVSTLFLFFVAGCKLEDSIVSPTTSKQAGQVLLKFNPTSIPSGITEITASLSRPGFTPISGNL